MTDVILIERVSGLGQPGDVVTVRPGYARNKLIPSRLALRATAANRALFEQQKAEIAQKNEEKKQAAQSLVEKLATARIIVLRQAGESGQLFGSVTSRDIADTLKQQELTVDKNTVFIASPIKTIGLHTVRIEPYSGIFYDAQVNVARNDHEAKVQFGEAKATSPEDEDDYEDAPNED